MPLGLYFPPVWHGRFANLGHDFARAANAIRFANLGLIAERARSVSPN
jgi:hypothetical protein